MIYIYCISSTANGVSRCYVGRTNDFTKRKNAHKSRCNNPTSKHHNYDVYKYIRENNGWDNFKMEVIEIIHDDAEEMAGHRELYWIKQKNADLNKQVPTRTKRQYHKDNKEKHNKLSKDYHEANKEKRNEKITCDCGCIVIKRNLNPHLETLRHARLMALLSQDK